MSLGKTNSTLKGFSQLVDSIQDLPLVVRLTVLAPQSHETNAYSHGWLNI